MEASAKHFYNLENLAQTKKFADLFFRTVEHVFETKSRDYADKFFHYLAPTFLRRDEDLAKFESLHQKHEESENTNFVNLISNEIDLFYQIKL